ncbi:MAG: hypothetical protein ACU0AT_11780 [Tranquillimonas sp.]|jgi:hypothetical protein
MTRSRSAAAAASLLLLAGFAAANAHLLSVAIGSQPECALAAPDGEVARRAAKPSC